MFMGYVNETLISPMPTCHNSTARNDSRRIIYFTPAQIGPYHIARFSKMVEVYPVSLVAGVPGWSPPRPWTFDLGRLFGRLVMIGNGKHRLNSLEKTKETLRLLNCYQPEAVVLIGYNDFSQWVASWWAKKHRVARILHADSWWGDRPRPWYKEFIKKHLFVRPVFDAAFVPGIRGFEYIKSLGVPIEAIWSGLYVVDNDHFSKGAWQARQEPQRYRSLHGLPENYFLVAARLSPEKNLERLFHSFAHYREQGGNWSLVVVGSGPQADFLRKLANSLAGDSIILAGWQQYEALPAFYGLAKCFILPSLSEPWGLVVNEAMAAGLPVLVSNRCGCQPDLCKRGINGLDFDPMKVGELAQLMDLISSGNLNLEDMGMASKGIVAKYSLETWIIALRDCIETTIDRVRS